MATELTARFGADSSGMSAAIEQLREKLSVLSTSLVETKQKIKEANTELAALEKEQRSLAAEMKDGGTKEQQAQMQTLQTRAAQLTANLGQLKAREKELQTDIGSTNRQLTEQKNGMNESAAATDKMNSSLSRITTAAKAFVAAYGGKKLFEMLIGSNAEMEQYQTSMEVMLGDAEKAQQMIEKMRTFAAKTPLAMTDIVSTGTMLMNYGVDDDELIDTMTKLGDLASGNAEKLNRVALAYGQMLAKGKVSGEELRQMTEAGVPLQTALAESIGVTGEEFSKMVSTGKVGIDDLNNAITELTSGDGKFSGMMEKQAQTMQGMLSTLGDEVSEFLRQLGEGAFGNIKDALSALIAKINEMEADGTLAAWAENFGNVLATAAKAVLDIIGFIAQFSDVLIAAGVAYGTFKAALSVTGFIQSLIGAIKTLTAANQAAAVSQTGLNAAMSANPVGLIVSVIAAAGAGLMTFAGFADKSTTSLKNMGQTAQSTISELKNLDEITEKYTEINDSVDDEQEKKAQLKELQDQLNESYKQEAQNIDLVNGAYDDQIAKLGDLDGVKRAQAINKTNEELAAAKKVYEEQGLGINKFTLNTGSMPENKSAAFMSVMNDIYSEHSNINSIQTNGNYDIVVSGNLEQRLATLKEVQQAIYDTGEATGLLAVAFNGISNDIEDLEEIKSTYDGLNESLAVLKGEAEAAGDEVEDTGEKADGAGDKAEETEEKISRLADTAEKSVTSFKNLSAEYSELASAVEEYHQNGELSIDTALQMIDNGYAAAVSIDKETGAVQLNIEAYQALAKEKLAAKKASIELERQQLNETNAILMNSLMHAEGADRDRLLNELTQNEKRILELNKLTDFYTADVDNWTSPDYKRPGTEKTETAAASAAVEEETDIYRQGYEAYKTEADKKIDLIEREIEKKKELRDETIKAIDDELAARKRLNEDKDFAEQINAIEARLKYDRLDDFSREQLKKQLGDIYDERAEVNYQRAAEDKKTAADEKYESDAAVLEQQKAQIETAVNTVKAITEGAAQGISTSTVINNNNSTRNATANINIANNALSLSAIKKAVKDALMDAITIR